MEGTLGKLTGLTRSLKKVTSTTTSRTISIKLSLDPDSSRMTLSSMMTAVDTSITVRMTGRTISAGERAVTMKTRMTRVTQSARVGL